MHRQQALGLAHTYSSAKHRSSCVLEWCYDLLGSIGMEGSEALNSGLSFFELGTRRAHIVSAFQYTLDGQKI